MVSRGLTFAKQWARVSQLHAKYEAAVARLLVWQLGVTDDPHRGDRLAIRLRYDKELQFEGSEVVEISEIEEEIVQNYHRRGQRARGVDNVALQYIAQVDGTFASSNVSIMSRRELRKYSLPRDMLRDAGENAPVSPDVMTHELADRLYGEALQRPPVDRTDLHAYNTFLFEGFLTELEYTFAFKDSVDQARGLQQQMIRDGVDPNRFEGSLGM